MWTQKYRPKALKEFVGQKEAVKSFIDFVKGKPEGKALLLSGPPGVGKSSLVDAYCLENRLDLIQMNASDYRSANHIDKVVGRSVNQQTLFKRSKIFFIDEIDGLVGRKDFGGAPELLAIIKRSNYPIVLAANNPYESKLRQIVSNSKVVKFGKVSVWDMERRLKEICDKEKISCEDGLIQQLSRMSDGDLRSAINDLEIIAAGKKYISLKDLSELASRERERSVFDALKIIFKTKSALGAKMALNNVDKDPEEVFWWIENNIANEYEDPVEMANAFDALSKADIFRRKISYRQNWRLLSYFIDMMTAGVAVSKKTIYRKFVKYQYPNNIFVLGRTKQTRKESKEVIEKLSSYMHCSSSKIKSQTLPYLKIILKSKRTKERFLTKFEMEETDLKSLFA